MPPAPLMVSLPSPPDRTLFMPSPAMLSSKLKSALPRRPGAIPATITDWGPPLPLHSIVVPAAVLLNLRSSSKTMPSASLILSMPSWKSQTAPPLPALNTNRSAPAPPISLSAPPPPSRVSSPAPPSIVFAELLPVSVSFSPEPVKCSMPVNWSPWAWPPSAL